MLQLERALVNTESAYAANEIEYRRLEQLHSQLESFNLQATLIVGFVFTTLNADSLVALSDDLSKNCIYKAPVVAHFYIVLTVMAVGLCMGCVMLSAYVVWKSQRTANDLSVRHTVALVRKIRMHIMSAYFVGMGSFFISFLFLLCAPPLPPPVGGAETPRSEPSAAAPRPPSPRSAPRVTRRPVRRGSWLYLGVDNWVPFRGPTGARAPGATMVGKMTGAPDSTCPTAGPAPPRGPLHFWKAVSEGPS